MLVASYMIKISTKQHLYTVTKYYHHLLLQADSCALENKDSAGKPKEFVLKCMSYEFKVSWLPIKFPRRQSHSLIYSRLKRRK
jgi:hypothetical protein